MQLCIVTIQGKLHVLEEIPPYLNREFFLQEKPILKMTMPQKNGSGIKTPSSFCWKKNFLHIKVLTNLI